MKTCPYCAEEVQDAAIKCRWCHSWLVDEIPAGAEGPPPKEAAAKTEEPKEAAAVEEPKPEPAQATAIEPVPEAQPEPEPEPAPESQSAPVAQPAPVAGAPGSESKIEFTHTGSRYLLGYAPDHFGIWDRNAPQQPLERFPRNDDGWAAAWARYAQIEANWMDLRTGQKSG